MLAQLEVIPLGTGRASLSTEVAAVADVIDQSGLDYRVGPMGTTVEGDWDAVMALAKRCHDTALQHAQRVMTFIAIDDRTDQNQPGRLTHKLASLQRAAGRTLRT